MSSKEHFEAMQAYKQMDKMDAYASRSGTQPAYQQSGVVDMGWSAPDNGSKGSTGGGSRGGASKGGSKR